MISLEWNIKAASVLFADIGMYTVLRSIHCAHETELPVQYPSRNARCSYSCGLQSDRQHVKSDYQGNYCLKLQRMFSLVIVSSENPFSGAFQTRNADYRSSHETEAVMQYRRLKTCIVLICACFLCYEHSMYRTTRQIASTANQMMQTLPCYFA